MINIITSVYTILKLLYKSDIQINYTNSRFSIVLKGNIKTVRVITEKLVLDYDTAYFNSTWLEAEHGKEPIVNNQAQSQTSLSEEDKQTLIRLAKELNVSCC